MQSEPEDFVQADPESALERAFIAEYLQRHGHTASTLHGLPPAEAMSMMREASLYASAKLGEVEARAHYVHDIHHAHDGSKRPA
jgi:hypothetical protein